MTSWSVTLLLSSGATTRNHTTCLTDTEHCCQVAYMCLIYRFKGSYYGNACFTVLRDVNCHQGIGMWWLNQSKITSKIILYHVPHSMGYSLRVSSMSPVYEDTEERVNMPSFLVIKTDSYFHLVFLCEILKEKSHDIEIKNPSIIQGAMLFPWISTFCSLSF